MDNMDKKQILLFSLIVAIIVAAIGIFTLVVRYYSRSTTEGASIVIPEAKGMTTPEFADDRADESVEDEAEPEPEKLEMTIVLSDYDYTYYGNLRNIHTLIGDRDVAVASFEPVGHYVDNLEWETVFISSEALKNLGEPNSTDEKGVSWWNSDWKTPHCYKLRMKNLADGGGYIQLPACVVELEEITPDDVPTWGGA